MRSQANTASRLLFLALCTSTLFIQGCGLGWLYMRIGDTHRIRGAKILEYDTTLDRFNNAQNAYRKALGYYRDSLLYDQMSNMDVYHKFGYTFLQMTPPDIRQAKAQFEAGIKLKRELADREGRTDELNETADDDFSQMNAGMGTVTFWTAVATKDEELLEKALKYYSIAENTASHRLKYRGGIMDKALNYFNLIEQLTQVPPKVLSARVYLYRARKLTERGHADRAKADLAAAEEAIDDALIVYPEDARAKAEMANLFFEKGEYKKCLKKLEELLGRRSYADKVEGEILRARALVKIGEPDKAIPIFTEIHERFVTIASAQDEDEDSKSLREAIKSRDANSKVTEDESNEEAALSAERDPTNIRVLVGRAEAYAAKGDQQSATADIDYFLRLDSKDPRLYLAAGKILIELKNNTSAIARLLKGYYIDTKNLALNYHLGKAYQAAGRSDEMKDCFARVQQLDPTCSFAKEVDAYLR